VKQGDSLYTIASKYKVNIKDIYQWNTIAGKYIKPGQKLKLFIDITEQSRHQS
jgi:membrane-bound lytic murein transglycosylase D